ncbi:hypothetical protein [Gluconacetobacter diazotrophicus]|uniref:hypothetical protein n=1 Tax=Gluconacetobacter diazotrophicus TaxID=33996 RepID=UPI0012FEBE34|nr:hypothetical protein [Gluconacetobacter diazotrophicus]
MGESSRSGGQAAMRPRPFGALVAGMLLCAGAAGCSTPARPYLNEGMALSQAGFVAHPADTTARYAMMNTLPPGQLTYRPSSMGPIYLYADPIGCGCVYMGSEAAYRTSRGAAPAGKGRKAASVQQDLEAMVAENRRDTALWDWSAWSSNADPGGDQPRHVIGGYW